MLTHCRQNEPHPHPPQPHWKILVLIFGMSGYVLDIPKEKWLNYLQTVETLIRCRIMCCPTWVCTVCQLPF